jgi:hypothetical protein
MLGFRLEKKSRIDSDVLFYILIIVYTVVFFLLIYTNMSVDSGGNLLDKVVKFSVCLLLGLLLSVFTSAVSTYSFSELFGWLFRDYYIRYYISDASLDIIIDNLLDKICNGTIPFIDDESINVLGYRVKDVKILKEEYNIIHNMIEAKRLATEQEELAKVRKKYEEDGVPKIYLGV